MIFYEECIDKKYFDLFTNKLLLFICNHVVFVNGFIDIPKSTILYNIVANNVALY